MSLFTINWVSNSDILYHILKIEEIMSEQQAQIDALAEQLGKAKAEIIAQVEALQAQIDAGGVVDLTALKAAVQGIDDLNPDAVV
jgi:hypothetical protein